MLKRYVVGAPLLDGGPPFSSPAELSAFESLGNTASFQTDLLFFPLTLMSIPATLESSATMLKGYY